jgi:carbamoyl-phosphate synthase large subunit
MWATPGSYLVPRDLGCEMKFKILVSSAGSMPAVGVIKALKGQQEYPCDVVAVDMDPMSIGFHLSDSYHVVPPASSADYIPALLSICRNEKVDVLFPIMDEELLAVAIAKSEIEEAGTKVVTNSPQTVRVCRDKWLTYQNCVSHGIGVPRTALSVDSTRFEGFGFPLIIKPRTGRGTIGVQRIDDAVHLKCLLNPDEGTIVQEFITGQEYTIDVLCNLSGELLSAVPKARLQVKAGMQVKGRTVRDSRLTEFARRVHAAFDLTPRANVQCILNDSGCYLVEVNPKFSTSLPLTVAAGVNLPLLLVRMLKGEALKPADGEFRDGVTMLRCWQEVFVTAPGQDVGQ